MEMADLQFSLEMSGDVRLAVYDVRGRRVRTLINGPLAAGEHEYAWDGRGENGDRVGPGIYFLHLATREQSLSRKVIVLP